MRSVSPQTICCSTRKAGNVARWPLISTTYSACELSCCKCASGTQNVAATSSLGVSVTSGSTIATNGRMMIGGSERLRGARSSRRPSIRPCVRSSASSSCVSRTAATSSEASPGSRRPPGNAMWPLHGSRSSSARLMNNNSGALSTTRSTAVTAASRDSAAGDASTGTRLAKRLASRDTSACCSARCTRWSRAESLSRPPRHRRRPNRGSRRPARRRSCSPSPSAYSPTGPSDCRWRT